MTHSNYNTIQPSCHGPSPQTFSLNESHLPSELQKQASVLNTHTSMLGWLALVQEEHRRGRLWGQPPFLFFIIPLLPPLIIHLHFLFTFSLYVSLGLKWVSCRQHIYGSCFCIHSASLYLLVGAFNPFTFKVIIDMYVPMTIFLIVLGLFL